MALTDLLPGVRRSEQPSEPEKPDEPTPPESHKGLLEIGGRPPYMWDTADPTTVERARRAFNDAVLSGYTAQSYTQQKSPWGGGGGMGYAGEMTREFNPEADAIRMTLPYAGG